MTYFILLYFEIKFILKSNLFEIKSLVKFGHTREKEVYKGLKVKTVRYHFVGV